jgi:tungstate transport system permease protein
VVDETLATVLRSVYVSGAATLLAMVWSLPCSLLIATRGRSRVVEAVVESLVGVPTVLIGLLLYLLLSSSGPVYRLLGVRLLYTPYAMVLGQAVLVTPLLISTTYRLLRGSARNLWELAVSLGASRAQAALLVLRESLPGIVASGIMGFSRAIGELGVALMLGGNIRGYTRVVATAIAMDVAAGEFEEALTLGGVLLLVVVLVAVCTKLLTRVYED